MDNLTQASVRLNGMYLNGVDTDRPRHPAETRTILRQLGMSVGVAKTALMDVYDAMQQSDREGYGSFVERLANGRRAMDNGPLDMAAIAALSLSADRGGMRLKRRTAIDVKKPTQQTRVSDAARIIATAWHTLQISRDTW